MPGQPYFRDFGIIPFGVAAPPAETIRCQLTWPQVIGQIVFSISFSCLGIGLSLFAGLMLDFPSNLPPLLIGACWGWLVYRATKDDLSWIEIDGDRLRAKYLYTRRLVERSISEITYLLDIGAPNSQSRNSHRGGVAGASARRGDPLP